MADFVIRKGCVVEYNGTDSEVVIPAGVREIAQEAFLENENIISIEIPEGVTVIGVGAFKGCTNIQRVTLPDTLQKIGMGAFSICTSLKEITIPKNVTSIGCSAFRECRNLEVVNYNATYCNDIVSDGNYDYYTYNDYGNFYDDIEPVFSVCRSLKTVNIGKGVKYIPADLFYFASGLEHVNILGKDTIKIGANAFKNCSKLEGIFVPKDVSCIEFDEQTAEPTMSKFTELQVIEGDLVFHNEFDDGIITEINTLKKRIKIDFGYFGIKTFIFPDAFYQGYLTLEK